MLSYQIVCVSMISAQWYECQSEEIQPSAKIFLARKTEMTENSKIFLKLTARVRNLKLCTWKFKYSQFFEMYFYEIVI
jgi:hypothetical protein